MFGIFGSGINLANQVAKPFVTPGLTNVQPQNGAMVQHPSQPIGFHQIASVQSAPMGPQGQQWANQQAQIAQQKALADALRKQQGPAMPVSGNELTDYVL